MHSAPVRHRRQSDMAVLGDCKGESAKRIEHFETMKSIVQEESTREGDSRQ